MDPIEEIDGNSRRALKDNTQRTSAFLRSFAQKAQRKPVNEAVLDEAQPPKQEDSLDFSSEFSSQDMGLDSQAESTDRLAWEELLDDDDWLEDDEDQDEAEDESEQQQDGEESEAEQLETSDALENTDALRELARGQQHPPMESQLGFSWGTVQPKSEAPIPKKAEGPTTEGAARSEPEKAEPGVSPAPKVSLPEAHRPSVDLKPIVDTVPRLRPPAEPLAEAQHLKAQVPDELANLANLLIVSEPSTPGYSECVRLLTRFGQGALRLCVKQRVQVKIYTERDFRTEPDLLSFGFGADEIPVDGAYLVGSRTCLIDRRCLETKPRFFHPGLLYLAHALDHAQGGENFSSRKAPAVRACFEALSQEDFEGNFVDELAATDPVRYFARSVAVYLDRDDCLEPFWTHKDLQEYDRAMFDYLEYLFARFSA